MTLRWGRVIEMTVGEFGEEVSGGIGHFVESVR